MGWLALLAVLIIAATACSPATTTPQSDGNQADGNQGLDMEKVTATLSTTPVPTDTKPAAPTATVHTSYLPNIGNSGPTQAPSPLQTPTPSPTLTPSPTPLPPPEPKPGYGIQVHLLAGDTSETLDWAEGLGVGWVKQQVEWHAIEHGPDDFSWANLDQAVAACNERGFKLLLGVAHAPDWTRPSELESGPPADYAEFGRFMGQLATRYKGRVAAYELWNEPNLAREWRGDTLNPARFVALVATGGQAVRAADPDAIIISGAPAVTGINDGIVAIDDRVYLRGMYAAGIAQWVDAIGVHPYGFGNPPAESWTDAEHEASGHNDHPSFFFRDTLEDYRAIMLEYGDATHSLWPTEFGWASVENMGDMKTTGWEYAEEVSEQEQGVYIVAAYHYGDERDWVGPMFLWNLNTAAIWGPENPMSAYSLLRPDRSYRPAYFELRWAQPLE